MSDKALASYATNKNNITITQAFQQMEHSLNGYVVKCHADGAIKEVHGEHPNFQHWSSAIVTDYGKIGGSIKIDEMECSRCPRPFGLGDKVYTKVFIQTRRNGKAMRVRETCCKTCAERSGFIKRGE